MTEIRLYIPENKGCPIAIEHEDFLGETDEDLLFNLKFDTFELSYPIIIGETAEEEGEGHCSECGGSRNGIPQLGIKDGNKIIFNKDFNKNWILFVDISKQVKSRLFEIKIKVYNADDGDVCEICENNRFHFELTGIVDSYSLYYYSPPKGEYMEHPIIPDKELNDELKEEMK